MSESTETVVLKVGGGSDPRTVGSALAHNISEGKHVQLRGVGAGAVNQAIKSVAIANQWTGPKGYILAVIPGFEDVPGKEEGSTISAITLTAVVRR